MRFDSPRDFLFTTINEFLKCSGSHIADFGGNGANERNEGQLDLDQLARLSQDLKNAATDGSSGNEAPNASQAEVPDVTKTANDQPMTAPKRGQSEYVEFVEPMHSHKLRGVETMEKRVPAVNGGAHGLNVMSGSSNVAFVGRFSCPFCR